MICKNCGSYNPDSNSFCGKCGKAVQSNENDPEIVSGSPENDQLDPASPEPSAAKTNESLDQPSEVREEQPWEKYCIYCQFKDKLLPSGDSYCSVCEQRTIASPRPEAEVASESLAEEEPKKTKPDFFIPQGRRTSRLQARMRERRSSRLFYEKVSKTTIAALAAFFLIGSAFLYLSRLNEKTKRAEAASKYLKTSDRLIRDFNGVVEKIGEIGNEVYLPDAGTFEERREKALAEIEVLRKLIEEKYETAKETETGHPDLEPLKKNLAKAYQGLLQVDLPELEDFARTVDITIIRAMMEGNFSKSSFNMAVGISKEASLSMEEAIELWHKKKNKL